MRSANSSQSIIKILEIKKNSVFTPSLDFPNPPTAHRAKQKHPNPQATQLSFTPQFSALSPKSMALHLRARGTGANLFKRKKPQKGRNLEKPIITEVSEERAQNTMNTEKTVRHFLSPQAEPRGLPIMYQKSRNGGVKLSKLLGGKEQLYNS